MSTVVVFGGSGFAGKHIVDELADRGHTVLAVARKPESLAERSGVQAHAGSALDADFAHRVSAGADVIIAALPAVDDEGHTLDVPVSVLLEAARQSGARLGVVGGAGSLLVSEQGPRLADTPEFPAFLQPIVAAHGKALTVLGEAPDPVDWFYLSPAGAFGAQRPGERTGRYRTGGLVLLTTEDGDSFISGADYAVAVADEIEKPVHHRERFTVGY